MLKVGDKVNLNGSYKGTGVVTDVWDADGYSSDYNQGRVRHRDDQSGPQVGVATADGRRRHYNGSDIAAGVVTKAPEVTAEADVKQVEPAAQAPVATTVAEVVAADPVGSDAGDDTQYVEVPVGSEVTVDVERNDDGLVTRVTVSIS